MKQFDARVHWQRGAQPFTDQRYSRAHAVGTLDQDERGRLAMTRILLRPRIAFSGRQPDSAELAALHHEAHARCYVANSLRSDIIVEGAA